MQKANIPKVKNKTRTKPLSLILRSNDTSNVLSLDKSLTDALL